ncbi:hypothetical protein AAE478_009720 [Parahypoxylon ruwenzoriense]
MFPTFKHYLHIFKYIIRKCCSHIIPSQHVYFPGDDRPEFISFIVPRLGLVYDLSGFSEYPARVGWVVHRYDRYCHAGRCPPGRCIASDGGSEPYGLQSPGFSKASGTEATCSEKVAFLQSWLFFGALAEAHAACNLPINPDDYSADTFDTAQLNGLPLKLYLASKSSGCAGSEKLRKKLYAIIRQGQLMMTRASEWEDEYDYTLTQCEVLFSIQVLLRILSLALLCQFRQPVLNPKNGFDLSIADPAKDWKPEGQMSMMGFTSGRLLGSGWCESELWHSLQGFDVALAACYLNRPYAPKNHGRCSDTTCMAYQINESTYQTLHVEDDCKCEFVHVDPAALTNVLKKNMVPTICITDDMQLSVVDGKGVNYIAFSHVWADGLGNPSHNALPSCQVRRLYNMALNLCSVFKLNKGNPKVAIWIDTLCIPVSPELKQYRKQAIGLLARTYTEAKAVLVLDRELCHFESRKAPILELGIRILCSGWLKRLWTLQEASLARGIEGAGALYIQMGDGPAHWNRLNRCFRYGPSRPRQPPFKNSAILVSVQEAKSDLVYEMHLLTGMEDRLPSVRAINESRFGTRFQKIMNAVQNRSTSKREDEPICMASLLGLELQPILNARDADERTVEFYKLLREIPTAILFAEFGVPGFLAKNLTIAPYRWVPRSLLLLEQPMEIDNAFSAMHFAQPPLPLIGTCEDDGLHIQHPGFVFEDLEPTCIARESTILDTVDGELYSLSLALSDGSPRSIGPIGRCALIFKNDSICSGVLIVRIESEVVAPESGVCFYVVIVGHAQVKRLSEDTPAEVDRDARLGLGCLRGGSTARGQMWCVT